MAVNYESKPSESKPKPEPVVVPTVGAPVQKDYAKDPIFQALLVGVTQKHGVEHFAATGKNTADARVKILIKATDNIREALSNG